MAVSESFVGRERELAQLDLLLSRALSGSGQLAFVAGEAGAGKTALLREFTRRAQEVYQDLIAAAGECNSLDGQGDPYLPFREVLALLTGDVDAGLAQGKITPTNAHRLRSLLARSGQVLVDIAPDLINVVIPGSRVVAVIGKAVASRVGWLEKLDRLAQKKRHESTLGEPALAPDRVFEEYTAFLRRLSEIHPLAITLDDLQWIDAASAGLLFHLGRRIADRPILILCAYRADVILSGRDGGRHPLEGLLNEFTRYTGQEALELAPASATEGRSFVDAMLDAEPNRLDEVFRDALWRHTEGHPLFLVELLHALRERGDLTQDPDGRWVSRPGLDWSHIPKKAEGVVGERIARLEEAEREMLEAASVEGDVFTAEVVATVLGRETRGVVRDLAKLDRQQGLVIDAGTRRVGQQRLSSYVFRHHLVQQYLYQATDTSQRAYLHEDVAKTLVALYGDQDEEIWGQLAIHYREAGDADLALHYSVLAGDRASRLYANADAVGHYTIALDLLPNVAANSGQLIHLFQYRGRALELSGQPLQALENYEEMERIGRQQNDPSLELAALAAQSILLAIPTIVHDPERGQRSAEAALALARQADDRAMEARILWSLLLINHYTGHYRQAVAFGEESLARARRLEFKEQLAFTLHDLWGAYWMVGEPRKAEAAVMEARQLWEELGNLPMLANAVANDAQQAFAGGDLGRALELSDEALRIGRSIHNLSDVSLSQTIRGFVFMERGDSAEGMAALREAVDKGKEVNNAYAVTGIRAELAWSLAGVGVIAEGVDLARQALAEAESHFSAGHDWCAALLVRIFLLAGDLPSALAVLLPAGLTLSDEHLQEAGMFGGVAIGLAAAELALAQGDSDVGQHTMEKLIAHLRQLGARLYLVEALQLQGRILLSQDKSEAAYGALVEARETAEAIGSRRLLWSVLDLLADLEESRGDVAASQELRRRAREEVQALAQNLGDPERTAAFLSSPRGMRVVASDRR